jgi:hypothetical protein
MAEEAARTCIYAETFDGVMGALYDLAQFCPVILCDWNGPGFTGFIRTAPGWIRLYVWWDLPIVLVNGQRPQPHYQIEDLRSPPESDDEGQITDYSDHGSSGMT